MNNQNQPRETELHTKLLVEIIDPKGNRKIREFDDPRIEYCKTYNSMIGRLGYVARPINPPSSQSV